MQVEVERRSGSQVTLTISVEPEKVQERMEQLLQQYARRVTVPGFRPGKAPRALVESRIDRSALLHDAIEDIIDATYKEAMTEEHLKPLEQGKVKDMNVGEDMSLTYQVEVSIFPEVKLPELSELVVRYTATDVTDEIVDAQIERLRESHADFAELADTAIEQGDFVTIDSTMLVDGEPYPEGDTAGYPLEVGSDTLFPELNEALLGLKTGDSTTVTTAYPADYSDAALAGKTATSTVVVQSVRRLALPELDDAWISHISNGSVQTVDELRTQMRTQLDRDAKRMDREHVHSELLNQLVAKSEIDVPATLVEEEYEHLMEELEDQLAQKRTSMEEYARNTNHTVADIENQTQIQARDMVRRSLLLQEIARREDIHVTDEELDAMVMINSFSKGGQSFEKVKRDLPKLRKEMEKTGQLGHLATQLFQDKVLAFLVEHADVVVEGWPERTEEAGEEALEAGEEPLVGVEQTGEAAIELSEPVGEETAETPEPTAGEAQENEPSA